MKVAEHSSPQILTFQKIFYFNILCCKSLDMSMSQRVQTVGGTYVKLILCVWFQQVIRKYILVTRVYKYSAAQAMWHTDLSTLLSHDPDLLISECLSRCYAAQWPCQCLCSLSMVFSIFVADVIFWLWWRLERICWITPGRPGCQKPHSASLPRCSLVFYLMLPAEGEGGYI